MPKAKSKAAFNLPLPLLLGAGLCLFLIFGDAKGCGGVIGVKPPVVVPVEIPVAVGVGINGTPEAVKALTDSHPGVIGAVQSWAKAKGGDFRLIDFNTYKDAAPEFEAPWVKEAWKVMKRDEPPRIVGATATNGIPDQPLPKTVEEVNKLLSTLK